MAGRWLSAAGGGVMCSLVVWAGCGDSQDSPTGTSGLDDAGGPATGTTGQDGGDVDKDSGADGSSHVDAALPPEVTMTYGSCPAFTPCGGDMIGTWTVSGGCLGEETFAAAKKPPCEGLQESDVVFKGAGVVSANATRIQRKTFFQISAKLAVPKACAAKALGSCEAIQFGLVSGIVPGAPTFNEATCTSDGAGGCNCSVSKKSSSNTDSEYTVSGNTLTSNSPTRTFDYCIDGSKYVFKETTAGTLPFVIELTK